MICWEQRPLLLRLRNKRRWQVFVCRMDMIIAISLFRPSCPITLNFGRRLRLITALCASPGLKLLGEAIPDLTLHTACIDEGVGEQGEIRPGIGDPVRRLNLRS